MNVSIIGAAGHCGRQVAAQLLDENLLPPSARVQLVGHHGGSSEHELWGLRADLEDAFVDHAPSIEVVLDPDAVDGDLVVMLAGVTISTDPNAPIDRAALGKTNGRIFANYADALAARPGRPPVVIVQSNPVELGVKIFAERLGPRQVLGAGALSDTLRLRAEIAADMGVARPRVNTFMLGQHGDHAVALWSQLRVSGVPAAAVEALCGKSRAGRTMAEFPNESRTHKGRMLQLVKSGQIEAAYAYVQALPADLRAVVKPFFTHFTTGHTTEMATAHAVLEMVRAFVGSDLRVIPAQVALAGEWLDIHGVVAAPVVIGLDGWQSVYPLAPRPDEAAAIVAAAGAIATANAAS
ncbi:MAG: lactate dehydrogenase [Pseudomonadota bacterium]